MLISVIELHGIARDKVSQRTSTIPSSVKNCSTNLSHYSKMTQCCSCTRGHNGDCCQAIWRGSQKLNQCVQPEWATFQTMLTPFTSWRIDLFFVVARAGAHITHQSNTIKSFHIKFGQAYHLSWRLIVKLSQHPCNQFKGQCANAFTLKLWRSHTLWKQACIHDGQRSSKPFQPSATQAVHHWLQTSVSLSSIHHHTMMTKLHWPRWRT